ncbi:hypothetical protein BH24ACT9_BH24ACT9_03660 [soil metagenome]
MTRCLCLAHVVVVVVGGGLAGLACAARLTGAGLDVQVLESFDAVGGRSPGYCWKPT